MKVKIRNTLTLLTFLIVGIIATVQAGKTPTKLSNGMSITKDLKINLESFAERFADMEIEIMNPKGEKSNKVFMNSSTRKALTEIQLGTQSDEREGCINLVDNRRIGKCEDGIYTFRLRAIDAPGNTSDWKEYKIERDTVKPNKTRGSLFLCGRNICGSFTGEQFGKIEANGVNRGQLGANGSNARITLLSNYEGDREYKFQISQLDEALNESKSIELKIYVPPIGVGDGDVMGDANSPYGSVSLSDLLNEKLSATVRLLPDGKLQLEQFYLPPPIITYIETLNSGKNVNIWGIALNKNSKLNVDTEIKNDYYTYGESAKKCNSSIPVPLWKYSCLSKYMGMNIVELTFKVPAYITYCTTTNPIDTNARNKCVEGFKKDATFSNQKVEFTLSDTELNFQKRSGIDFTSSRLCIGFPPCYNGSTRVWNDTTDGKWQLNFENEPQVGNIVHTYLTVYGNISVNFQDKTYTGTFGQDGWRSGWSNEVTVAEPPKSFWESVVHPLAYDSVCKDFRRSRGVLHEGKPFSHTGVDLAKKGGCKINVVGDGKVEIAGYWGEKAAYTVIVNHNNGFKTYHYHGTGVFYVKKGENIKKGQFIMHMGNTGNSDGTHLHITLKKFKSAKDYTGEYQDPEETFYFGDLSPDGKLFLSTKQY